MRAREKVCDRRLPVMNLMKISGVSPVSGSTQRETAVGDGPRVTETRENQEREDAVQRREGRTAEQGVVKHAPPQEHPD